MYFSGITKPFKKNFAGMFWDSTNTTLNTLIKNPRWPPPQH